MRPLRHSDRNASLFAFGRIAQHIFQNAVHDQVRIPPNRRSEMRVRRGRQREVALVLLRVARLFQRTQHQVRQDALLRLARNFLRQLLIHARRDVDFFRQFDGLRLPSRRVCCSRRSAFNCTRFTGSAPTPSEYPNVAAIVSKS